MNIQRLQVLADFLKTVPAEKFDLQNWRAATDYENPIPFGRYVSDTSLKIHCGTTGCAVGWAGTIPEFKAAGFSFYDGFSGLSAQPCYLGSRGWDAVCQFFKLSMQEARYLFTPSYYPNADNLKHVIDRINHVVKHGFPKKAFNYGLGRYCQILDSE